MRPISWTILAALLAPPLLADGPIELPGCSVPAPVQAASRLPSELGRSCGGDADCWRAGLERARGLVESFPASYDAHRVRVLVARGAAEALGAGVVSEAVAQYEALASSHPSHPAYPHLLAQLRLEGPAYETELARIAAAHPDYPWAQLSIAYLARPDSSEEVRARARFALERFVALCPARYDAVLPALERLPDPAAGRQLAARLRAPAIESGDFVATARLWSIEARTLDGDPEAATRLSVTIRQEIARLTRGGLPAGLPELEALRIGHDLAVDPEGRAVVDESILARHPCSMAARRARAALLVPRLGDAVWLGVGRRRQIAREVLAALAPTTSCVGDESALLLRIDALGLLGEEAAAELLSALDAWLEMPGKRDPEPELAAAERLLDAGVGFERLPDLLARARARRESAGGGEAGLRELRIAAETAFATGTGTAARSAIERFRAALDATAAGGSPPAATNALERLDAGLRCTEQPEAAAVDRFARLLGREPEAGAAEREARRCWIRVRGGADGFDAWRRERSLIATAPGGWRTVEESLPPASFTDLAGEAVDWSSFAGRTVLVRAWAGWCGPCRAELPALGALAERFAGRTDIVILLASADADPSPVIELMARDALPVDALLGGETLLGAGRLERVPAAWIVSPSGRVVRRQEGPAGDDPAAWIDAAAAAIAEVAGPDPAAAVPPR